MVKKEKFQAPADTIGAVMVVGGGISGMQASLDMADSGFKVYLVERNSTIGGKMAQLDKTFPTNDCSTCMISPKLIEVASNPNIEILTLSNIKEISGIPGNFRVKVKTRPRYIDLEKCTACGECTKVCPVDIPADFDESLGKRKAVYRHFPQAIPAEYLIDKADRAPCNRACPAGINVQGYIAMIKVGKYKEAIEIIMKDMPLPGVLGRVCFNPCEDACRRAEVDAPLSIRDLKRFAAKQVDLLSLPLPDIDWKNEKVAIVGSGPSGLSAGYFLGLKGYRSTIFEALPVAGGMLAVGIPQYRLPGEVLNKEIENIKRFGVEIRTSSPIGKDHTVDDLLKEGYTSVYIAVGAHRGTGLRLPGEEDYSGILHGVGWLRDISLKKTKRLENKKVVIIGGGNTAIDAARSAIRFGAARVEILYRRTSEEMPANPHEIDEALKEGVKISYLVSPVSIKGERKILQGLVCVKNRLEKSDASGRPRPVPIDGSDFFVEADLILPSIGQGLDESCLNETGIGISERGWIVSDPETMETDKIGVFAGGDAVLGPTSVIEAIAQGKQAAQVIADFIQGKEEFGVKKRKLAETPNYRPIDHDIIEIDRAKVPSLEVPDRVLDFREVAQAFSEDVARKEASRCLDCGICCECFQCVDACKADAINHNDTEKIEEISVGSIILSPGFKTFDAHEKPEYGHGRFPNVLTSIEYERMLSAAGPFQGHIIRPSDHKEPKKIAWLQCIGSRDASIGYDYCSYVCCMYATKQAIISKEHDAGIETAIFYIDMRAQGKGFDRYYERARTSLGVRYVRSMVSRVIENPLTKNLEINFIDEEGELQTEEFDMVILSVGLRPHPSIDNLSKNLGIDLNPFGFCETEPLDTVSSSRPGIFVSGLFQSPKDIPDTVIQASAAAAAATSSLSKMRGSLEVKAVYPDEIDISGEEPKIGVFVCHCGINIASVVDVAAVSKYAGTLDNVVFSDHFLFTCSTDTQAEIKRIITEKSLNRVVIASCSPRTHESLFQNTLQEAGLNKYLFEMTNIRDQDSWVHVIDKAAATEKAKDLVRMSVARSRKLKPLYEIPVEIVQKGLVVGGGAAGLTAALTLAEQGFETCLVEKSEQLGGNALTLYYTEDGASPAAYVEDLIQKVKTHPLITVCTDAIVSSYSGVVGNFRCEINENGDKKNVDCGIIIAATGGMEYKPTEYLYGQDKRIFTQKELEQKLYNADNGIKKADTIVMIQCVGSRNEKRPYCSRVCCTAAIKNSLKIKKQNPNADIYVLYRDIRTFSFKEIYYKKAREAGVRFIRYDSSIQPAVKKDGSRLKISVYDQNMNMEFNLETDMLILSAAIVPHPDNKKIAETFKLPLDQDGFFMEAHLKLRPLDFPVSGIFLCGLAHGPKFADESIAQAKGAVSRACTILSKATRNVGGAVASVNKNRCIMCLTCLRTCPFGVPKEDKKEGVIFIDPAACQGCGNCASACPRSAIEVAHHTNEQYLAMIEALFP